MRMLRSWRLVVAAVVIVIVALGVWVAIVAHRVDKSLSAAQADAGALKSAVADGDQAGITGALSRLQSDSAAAKDATASPAWSLAAHLPIFGDDARGVRLASTVIDQLSHRGLEQLAHSATRLESIVPRHGAIDVDAITALQQPVGQATQALSRAQAQLDSQDAAHFVQTLKDKYRFLQSEIDQAATMMRTANTAVQVLPTMLGQDGPKNYLLIFQNNAEIRATGGLPGAVSLVRADDGKLSLVKQVSDTEFGEAGQPALPLTNVERQLYGNQLGTYFVDANFTPDFPRSADLWRARWDQVEGTHLDGVLSLDPVTLSYILKATGPIQAGDTQLTSDNVVDTLLSQAYEKYADPAEQDAFFALVGQQVFNKVATDSGNPQGLLAALTQGVQEHRVYVHSFDPTVQQKLDDTAVTGTFETEPTSDPQVNVTVNDTTGAKMSYYLRYQVGVTSTYCTNGVQGLSGSAEITSTAPKDAATSLPTYVTGGGTYGVRPGQQLDTVRVFGPIGGKIGKLTMNGKPLQPFRFTQDGRPVAMFYAQLNPGQVINYDWTMTTGPDQTGPTSVDVTPSVVAGNSSSTAASTCG